MVETGHISHNGFLIGTSSVHNVYEAGGDVVMKTNIYISTSLDMQHKSK